MSQFISISAVLLAALTLALAQEENKSSQDQGAPAKSSGTTTASPEGSKPSVIVVDSTTKKMTVQDIDKKKRTVKLKDEQGNTETVQVGEAAINFDQIQKGDTVRTTYYESVVANVHKATEAGMPSHVQKQVLIRAPKGEKPSGVLANTTEIKAIVEDIDLEKRIVTLRGPEGNLRTHRVSPDVQNLSNVRKGDELILEITEALAIDVSKQ